MATESLRTVVKRRFLGVVFIALVVGLISLSIAIYNKAFTTFTDITLKADHTGNELQKDSDVKLDGLIVGSVDTVESSGSGAKVRIKLDQGQVKKIPADLTAQILPKTLFGEQYVALSAPKGLVGPGNPAIKNGDVIAQDRSKGALESQKVLGDFYPLLTAVRPEDLNATLTALATALSHRGDELGQTLVDFDKYLKVMNPHTAQLVQDLKALGKVSLEYHSALPNIYATLQNLETGARTLVQKQAQLSSLLTTGVNTSDVLRGFLAENQQRIIAVSDQTNRIFPLLERYSPEFKCLFAGINNLYLGAGSAIYDHQIHLEVSLTGPNDKKPYRDGQQPRYIDGIGPNCFGLPNPQKPFQIPQKYACLNDGATLGDNCSTGQASGADDKALNSSAENAYVNALVSGSLHTTPNKVSGVATLLSGPLLRGHTVVSK